MIKFEIDDHEFIDEIDRIVDTAKLREDLSDVLRRQFDSAQSLVHVHSGGLKTSGSKTTEYYAVDKQWEGTLEWSDPAAFHELYTNEGVSEEEGTPHTSWWDSLSFWDDAYLAAIMRHYRGDDR